MAEILQIWHKTLSNQSIKHAISFENSYRKHDTLYVLIKECEFYSIDRCFRFSYI